MNSTSATLAAWGNAWLSGHVGLDEAVDAVERHGGPQVIGTVPPGDLPFEEGVPLRAALVRLRGLPGTRPAMFRLALPVQGDPLGLVGPGEFNQAALEAREGVLLRLADRQVGLVPTTDRRGSSYVGVSWSPYPANDTIPQVPGLAEAEQELKTTLIEVARELEGVDDVAGFAPAVQRRVAALDARHADGVLPPGYPQRARGVAEQAARLAAVVDLADDRAGRGLSAHQADARSRSLRRLDAAVRRALVAAHASLPL
ncbi:hypothetical protein SAMN05421803_1414 [Nocardiopsis flavescens]|uniref:Uncharacterized protein n=1 Tax=Nocardiopsis flavescens TaxID=758803 RepID=A0A1M6W7K1_9ACTN|nr:hypothetical protein [Nocardiopsis flavescens]SHK89723.1 hypothetical protein SAMN05421803_1414 [Nocardiopsis flavescens]